MPTTGLCTNLPSRCSKAAAKEPIPMPTPDVRCPECDSPLQPVRGQGPAAARRRGGGGAVVAVAALLALLALGWIGFSVFGGRHGDRARGGFPGVTAHAGGGAYLLRLSGSNTIGARLGPDLVKAWLASKGATDVREEERTDGGKPIPERVVSARLDGRDVRVEVRAHGSATAFTDLAAGGTDIGMASRPIKDEEVSQLASLGDMRSTANEHVLGLDGVAVILPDSSAVQHLSRADLQRIFSGEATSWSAFGGSGDIHLYARDDKSGTYDTFKDLVLKGKKLGDAKRFEDSAELEAAVSHDPGGVGFVGLPYVKTTRAAAVSDGPSAALEPTRFSVKTENYPLSRRLFLYTAANPTNPAVREFTNFALSAAGQALVRAARFVDLDLTETAPREAPATTAASCRLSEQFAGDRDSYCRLRQGTEQLGTSFRFRTGSAELDTRATQDLRRVLDRMEHSSDKHIVLAGFADSSGGYSANCALSRSRAQSVAQALKTLGLEAAETLGFCSELPVRDNGTPEGREQNRRVEIFLR